MITRHAQFQLGICLLLAAGAWRAAPTAAAQAQWVETPAISTSAPGLAPPLTQPAAHAGDSRYRLQQGDSFEVNFPFVGSINQTVTVQRDGYVSLRMVGDVRVIGLSVPEVADTLR